MKKILLGLCLVLLNVFAHAQGLENVIVERYYVSDANDAAGTIGTLPVGSVTYRVYVDMLPGYKFQALYGVANHELKLTTTTSFFNNEDRGATTPNGISVTNTKKNSVMIDSWFSTGATAAGKLGVLKTEDNDGSIGNTNGILQNNDTLAGIPVMTQDGMIAGTPEAVTFVGLTTELDVFDAISQLGNTFSTMNGSVASLNGSVGPTSTNRVLIGQFTTDGKFCWELNVQIGTPGGGTENYVAQNPTGGEIQLASLMGCLGGSNLVPTINITTPADGANFITGDVVTIEANAADSDGIVSSVEFFVDASSIGVDNTAPYTASWTSVLGSHSLTAKATDDLGGHATSSVVTINIADNVAPSVNVTSPANGSSFIVGDVVAIEATSSDVDGTVSSVEFFVGASSVGIDNVAPYTANWTSALGSHSLTAKAIDDRGAQTTSSIVTVNVINNTPPTVNITSPTNGSSFTAPAVVSITANAADVDGTVSSVEFFVNGGSVGSDATAPYQFDWTSVIGMANLTAVATDNKGGTTTSPVVTIEIADPNALPYKVVTTVNTCLPNNFCVPVAVVDSVENIIGYDIVMHYDVTKVQPTGSITTYSDLINSSYVDVINSIDTANGLINISEYLNSSAPLNASFNGKGNLFCVEFTKTADFESIDTAVFSISTVQESYYSGVSSKLAQSGEYTTYKDSTFRASLKFWVDDSPIRYNATDPNQYLITNIYGNNDSCNSKSLVAVQPDTLGNFNYNIWNGLNVSIEKDILSTTDVQAVVNGFDALLTRKVLLNDLSFIPSIYQMIAMDVNTDGSISAGDVSQINQRTVLMIREFKQAWNHDNAGNSNGQSSKDWLFVDSSATLNTNAAYVISATYPLNDGVGFSKYKVPVVPFCLPIPVVNYADCPLISLEQYDGILLGDVNGNYSTVVPNGMFKTASDKVVFDLSKAVITGNFIDVPVHVLSRNSVNALDFAIQYNEENLRFNSIVDHTSYLESLANFDETDRTLRFTSNSLKNYDINKSLISVRFAMNNEEILDTDLNTLQAYLNGDRTPVEVISRKSATLIINDENSIEVYPNPANGTLNIEVSENATMQLLDIDGRQVIMQTNINENQKQEINIQNIANGIYIIKIYNDNFVSMKKLVINNK